MGQVTGRAGTDECEYRAVGGSKLAFVELGTMRSGVARSRRWVGFTVGAVVAGLAALGLSVGLIAANRHLAPYRYQPEAIAGVADALAAGTSLALPRVDLNVRALRAEQIKRLQPKPDLIILGGDAWGDAGAALVPGKRFANLHVPQDHYEDLLGLTELLVRHDRLPRDLVLGVRAGLLTPADRRSDFDWLTSFPAYLAMSARLGLAPVGFWQTYPLRRYMERMSVTVLAAKVARWHLDRAPSPIWRSHSAGNDVFHPDGTVSPSGAHLAAVSAQHAARPADPASRPSGLSASAIDPRGVEALDRLLAYLGVRNVRVHMAFSPYEPASFDRMQGTPGMDDLRLLETVIRELADRHRIEIVGSFDPRAVGCPASMFIDEEHASGACLGRILAEVTGKELPHRRPPAQAVAANASRRCLGAGTPIEACERTANAGGVE